MRKRMFSMVVLSALLGSMLHGQDIADDCQGTLKVGAAGLRLVLHVSNETDGAWKVTLFSIDQGPDGIAANAVTLKDSTLKMTFDPVRGSYEGKLSADGTSIQGTWSQGLPL